MNFQALDEGTQGLIRDLLRQRDETRRQLDAAQIDQVVIRGQLSNADTRVASKPFCILLSMIACSFLF